MIEQTSSSSVSSSTESEDDKQTPGTSNASNQLLQMQVAKSSSDSENESSISVKNTKKDYKQVNKSPKRKPNVGLKIKSKEVISSSEESDDKDGNIKSSIKEETMSIKGGYDNRLSQFSLQQSKKEINDAKKNSFPNVNTTLGKKDKRQLDNRPSDEKSSDDSEKDIKKIEEKIQKSAQKKVQVLQDVQIQKPTDPHERLRQLYPGLSPVKTKTKISFSENDDVYLLRIPKNVNPELMKGLKIDLKAGCKIDLGEKYIIEPTSKIPEPTLFLANNTIVIPFKNSFIMEKCVKLKKQKVPSIDERKPVALPAELKERHPLFGPEYKPKIKLSEEIEKKLDEAINNLLKKESKKRKKEKKLKKKSLTEPEENLKNEMIFDLLNSYNSLGDTGCKNDSVTNTSNAVDGNQPGSSTKKQKKTKQSIVSETLDSIKSELFTDFQSELPVKSKKKKRKDKDTVSEDSAISTASSGAVLEGMGHKKNKKDILEGTLKIVKSEIFTEYEPDSNTPSKSKKKKKKDKNKEKESNFQSINNNEMNNEAQSTAQKESSKKRKKTKDLEFLNSLKSEVFTDVASEKDQTKEIKTEISFEFEPGSSTKSKSKKKKKDKSDQVTIKSEVVTEYESDFSMKSKSSKKKKKSKYLEQTSQPNTPVQSSKEMKRLSIINSTLMSDVIKTPMFNPELSRIAAETSKNSKRNAKNEEENKEENALISELMSSLQNEMSTSKKKKRKHGVGDFGKMLKKVKEEKM